MTNILGTIADSAGNPVAGTLTVSLPVAATSDTTVPDTVYTVQPVDFAIAATLGNLDIDLPESQTYDLAYRFVFVSVDGETLITLDAIVPNVGTVQFASFFPTGITNRNLDDGALRVARLLANDPTLSLLIKQPAVFSVELVGVPVGQIKRFMPKPFQGAMFAKSLTILGISGYENWTFQLGVLNSSGNEQLLTIDSTSTVTQNGRRRIFQNYEVSNAASVMGLYFIAAPQAGATDLTATLSISYSELGA
jgi:hypothetical protein